jgi:hypothetical protein
VVLAGLLACQANPLQPLSGTPPALPEATLAAQAVANTGPDLTGCWRQVALGGGDEPLGPAFQIIRLDAANFAFEGSPHTRLQMDGFRFKELNRNDAKPFYPVGMVVSEGLVGENVQAITRQFPDRSERYYRRCELVANVAVANRPVQLGATPLPVGVPVAATTPVPMITPLVGPPRPAPVPLTSSAPIPDSSAVAPTPLPADAPTNAPPPLEGPPIEGPPPELPTAPTPTPIPPGTGLLVPNS